MSEDQASEQEAVELVAAEIDDASEGVETTQSETNLAEIKPAKKPAKKRATRSRKPPAKGKNNQKEKQQTGTRKISDLTPDRQAEIASSRAHQSAKRKQFNRPQLPAVSEDIELHTAEIHLLYVRHFKPCNEYAIAIDHIARERLTDRSHYNRYLQDFDAAIEELSEKIRKLFAEFEELSAGSMTTNRSAQTFNAEVHTRRSLQIHRLFKNADDIIRMVQFLNIYNDLDDRTASKALDTIENSINRCVRALRKVKLECFKRIVQEESLRIPVSDATTVEDLAAARQIAKIGKGNKDKGKQKVVRTRSKKAKPTIDPAEPAGQPLEETNGDIEEAEPIGKTATG